MGHIHEKIDFTASVYIVYDNRVLLHQHKVHKTWLPPGGHIELHEDPLEAVLREAKEETGLDITLIGHSHSYPDSPYDSTDLIPPRFLSKHYFDTTRTHQHVDLGYLARAASADVRHEIAGMKIRWFTAEELSDPTYDVLPDVQAHANVALKELADVN